MTWEIRKPLLEKIETLRGGRTCICLFNFDRTSDIQLPALTTQFSADVKEPLFRVLKESPSSNGIDLCLYTRGGDTNAVWPIVSLLREFDKDFEVLVPFRCHSSGTLAALGAKRIVMSPIAELSPIDPTTGNAFNPIDPANTNNRIGISVEDVQAYRDFVLSQLRHESVSGDATALTGFEAQAIANSLQQLAAQVHPLALGNVRRVLKQIELLAKSLLDLHPNGSGAAPEIVAKLTTHFYSHLHMINRHEAKAILGDRIEFADEPLAVALDNLLREYEGSFNLRKMMVVAGLFGGVPEVDFRFIGGVAESRQWSYLFETAGKLQQTAVFPPNVQVQVPAGQPLPLVPGLPRNINVEVRSHGWVHNTEPRGFTQ